MRICTTPYGQTYVGYSDLMTIQEWETYLENGTSPVPARVKALGGRKYKGKKYGTGFTFPRETETSLEKKAKEMFPQLFE